MLRMAADPVDGRLGPRRRAPDGGVHGKAARRQGRDKLVRLRPVVLARPLVDVAARTEARAHQLGAAADDRVQRPTDETVRQASVVPLEADAELAGRKWRRHVVPVEPGEGGRRRHRRAVRPDDCRRHAPPAARRQRPRDGDPRAALTRDRHVHGHLHLAPKGVGEADLACPRQRLRRGVRQRHGRGRVAVVDGPHVVACLDIDLAGASRRLRHFARDGEDMKPPLVKRLLGDELHMAELDIPAGRYGGIKARDPFPAARGDKEIRWTMPLVLRQRQHGKAVGRHVRLDPDGRRGRDGPGARAAAPMREEAAVRPHEDLRVCREVRHRLAAGQRTDDRRKRTAATNCKKENKQCQTTGRDAKSFEARLAAGLPERVLHRRHKFDKFHFILPRWRGSRRRRAR